MKRTPLILLVLALFLILPRVTTSDQTSNQDTYTVSEKKQLETCLSTTDAARYIASEKKKGVPVEKMKEHFSNIPSEIIPFSLIDKIYGEQFDNAWDYAMIVFDDCAQNIAEISPARASHAHRCMADQFMVDVTRTLKSRGIPKEKVYSLFKTRNGKSSKPVINIVYASSKSRGQLKLDIWNKCLEESLE